MPCRLSIIFILFFRFVLEVTAHFRKRQRINQDLNAVRPGLVLDSSCKLTQIQQLTRLAEPICDYIAAALHAIRSQDQRIFNFFFTPADRKRVFRGFRRLDRIAREEEQKSIYLVCLGFPSAGETTGAYAQFVRQEILEQTGVIPRVNIINFCSKYFDLRFN